MVLPMIGICTPRQSCQRWGRANHSGSDFVSPEGRILQEI
jgi:hypothetical protein